MSDEYLLIAHHSHHISVMKIALFGYGKMGRMVEQAAERRGHEIVCVVDPVAGSRGRLDDAEVCVDFSEPGSVMGNIRIAAAAPIPMVVGTTGWYQHIEEARSLVQKSNIGFVYGSNFSVGVNLMFKIVQQAAGLFSRFPEYDPFVEEAHHKFKKDAPSGTAVFLQRFLEASYGREIPTASTRAGYIPGNHTVGFDSEGDTLAITHTARSRGGFADGAIIATEWIANRKGFYEFSQVMDEVLGGAGE
ncbi:MAG TPA: dihydrodipicolinate reductase C-terminal domain-containing protein [Blastocatellia bacterium]|nr:dihydrodipicolinate reductase C-terminal domain-containing protein [Blastocatellia bacterium]